MLCDRLFLHPYLEQACPNRKRVAPPSSLSSPETDRPDSRLDDEVAHETPVHVPGETDAFEQASYSLVRYLCATLIARLFDVFSLTCRRFISVR